MIDLPAALIYMVWALMYLESVRYGTLQTVPEPTDLQPVNRRIVDMVRKQR